jgi:hypothetical protein
MLQDGNLPSLFRPIGAVRRHHSLNLGHPGIFPGWFFYWAKGREPLKRLYSAAISVGVPIA